MTSGKNITWNNRTNMKYRIIRFFIYLVVGFAAAFLYRYFKK